ncbi:MAG TPA: hypothetical protein VMT62_13115 [Syntrophorhabdaceae bacterium]|nr:hypothetical protein [Syntrophorhabdaceae bacterium]
MAFNDCGARKTGAMANTIVGEQVATTFYDEYKNDKKVPNNGSLAAGIAEDEGALCPVSSKG